MPRLGKQNSVRGRAGRSLRSPGHGPTSRHWPPVPYQSVWQQIWRTPLSIEGRAGGPYLGWPPLPLLDTRRYGYGYQIGEYVVKSAMQPGVAASR